MNKVELIDEITKKTGLTKKDTDATLKAFIEAVTETLAKGDSVVSWKKTKRQIR